MTPQLFMNVRNALRPGTVIGALAWCCLVAHAPALNAAEASGLKKMALESLSGSIPFTLSRGDHSRFMNAVDANGIISRALEGMAGAEAVRAPLTSNLRDRYLKDYAELFKDYEEFEFVHTRTVNGYPVITIRMVANDWRFDYLQLTVGFRPNSEARVVDIYACSDGEMLTEKMRRVAGATLAARNSRHKAQWGEWAEHGKDVWQIVKMCNLDQHAEVLRLQTRLPPRLRHHKSMQTRRVVAILMEEPANFPAAMHEFERLFPNDPTTGLLNCFAAYLTENYAAAFPAIDLLEKHFGDTNHCNYLRAYTHYQMGESEQALPLAVAALPRPRNMGRVTALCITLWAELKKFDDLAKLLREIERDTPEEVYSLIRDREDLREFYRSEAFRRWVTSPIKRPMANELVAEVKALLAEASAPAAVVAPAKPPPAPGPVAPAKPAAPPPRFQLKAILYSKTRPSALINGTSVFVGEKVDGAKVLKIEPTMVTLEVEGKPEVLTLPDKLGHR